MAVLEKWQGQDGEEEVVEAEAAERTAEERAANRREVGREIIKRHLPLNSKERLRSGGEVVRELLDNIPEDELKGVAVPDRDANGGQRSEFEMDQAKRSEWLAERAGLSIDAQNKLRLKVPGRADLAGSYFNEEVLKALVVGLKEAGTDPEKQWQVAADACNYLGVEAPPKPEAKEMEEVKKAGGMLAWLKQKGAKTAGILALLALFKAEPLMDAEPKGTAAEPGEPGRPPVVEAAEARQEFHEFKSGENPTRVVHELYVQRKGVPPSFDQLMKLTAEFCRANDIRSAALGVGDENTEDTQIPIGFRADITSTLEMMGSM